MNSKLPGLKPDGMQGLKESDLEALGKCCVCGKSQLGKGPTFYKVTVERGMFLPDALQRRFGLGGMIGQGLARVMGPDEDLAKIWVGPVIAFIHEQCALSISHPLEIIERALKSKHKMEDKDEEPSKSTSD